MSLNDSIVSTSLNTFAYRAYIETLLSYGPAAKKSQLTAALYYKDQSGRLDSTNPWTDDAEARNSVLVTRAGFTKNSQKSICLAVFNVTFFQPRYMLSEVALKLKLIRSRDAFCLMGERACKVKTTHASFIVRKVKISPSVYLAHARVLETGTAKYPI